MKVITREMVLLFLLSLPELPRDQFNEAFEMYRNSKGKSLPQERFLNRAGFTPSTLNTLMYELKKLYKITDADLRAAKVEVVAEETVDTTTEETVDTTTEETVDTTTEETTDAVTEETPVIGFVPDVEQIDRTEEFRKVIESAPEEVKNEIRFRDEFPFISAPNLPDELKILITEKFNHYHAFCDIHKELIEKVVKPHLEGKKEGESELQITNDVIFGLAKSAVENFEMDQLIYDEFVHYRDNKKVLGLHPIFKRRKLAEAVDKMTMAEASKRKTNLENYIRRDGKKADEAKTPEDKAKFEQRVLDFKEELILVNLKLGESVTK